MRYVICKLREPGLLCRIDCVLQRILGRKEGGGRKRFALAERRGNARRAHAVLVDKQRCGEIFLTGFDAVDDGGIAEVVSFVLVGKGIKPWVAVEKRSRGDLLVARLVEGVDCGGIRAVAPGADGVLYAKLCKQRLRRAFRLLQR